MTTRQDETFTAIDVELANNASHSICEIGIVRYRHGSLIETWRTLVDPKEPFEQIYHSRVHGIRESQVVNAPSFDVVHSLLKRFFIDETCVFHGSNEFDRRCIASACKEHGLEDVTGYANWISTLDLARQTWPDESSHKLEALCKKINHIYQPHNALEDAFAAANLYLHCIGVGSRLQTGSTSHKDSEVRTYRSSTLGRPKGLKGNPDGKFYATHIVYTGQFSPPYDDRNAFALYLDDLGFVCRGGFSRKTQYLVTGQEPGPKKIKDAKELGVKILTEPEFLALINGQ